MNQANIEKKRAIFDKVGEAVEMTKDERYAEALEVFEETLPQLSSADVSAKPILSKSSSFYGVCVAMVKRRYAEAVKYCNLSLKSQFMDPDHHTNLGLLTPQ